MDFRVKLVPLVVAGLLVLPATAAANLPPGSPPPPKPGTVTISSSPAQPEVISMAGTTHPKCTTLSIYLPRRVRAVTLVVGNPFARHSRHTLQRPIGHRTFKWCGAMEKTAITQPVKHSGRFRWRVYVNLRIHRRQGRLTYTAVTPVRLVTVVR